MKKDTRDWIRSHFGLLAVAFIVLGGVVPALIAQFLSPSAGHTVMTTSSVVAVLTFAAFYGWFQFPINPRNPSGDLTLRIGAQLERTKALLYRAVILVLAAWCLSIELLVPSLTARKRSGLIIAGILVLCLVEWLVARSRLRCPRCGSDFRKERIARLGRWSMDTRGATDIWDACPHCGVSFNEPWG